MFDAFLGFDLAVFDWIQRWFVSPLADGLMIAVTYAAYGIWVVLALILLYRKKTRRAGVTMVFSLLLMVGINNLFLKNIFCRPRPFISDPSLSLKIPAPGGYSFPSGHASSSSCAAFSLLGENRLVFSIAVGVAFLVSFSRIYLQVHYCSDVVFGFLLGILYNRAAVWFVRRFVPVQYLGEEKIKM